MPAATRTIRLIGSSTMRMPPSPTACRGSLSSSVDAAAARCGGALVGVNGIGGAGGLDEGVHAAGPLLGGGAVVAGGAVVDVVEHVVRAIDAPGALGPAHRPDIGR